MIYCLCRHRFIDISSIWGLFISLERHWLKDSSAQCGWSNMLTPFMCAQCLLWAIYASYCPYSTWTLITVGTNFWIFTPMNLWNGVLDRSDACMHTCGWRMYLQVTYFHRIYSQSWPGYFRKRQSYDHIQMAFAFEYSGLGVDRSIFHLPNSCLQFVWFSKLTDINGVSLSSGGQIPC